MCCSSHCKVIQVVGLWLTEEANGKSWLISPTLGMDLQTDRSPTTDRFMFSWISAPAVSYSCCHTFVSGVGCRVSGVEMLASPASKCHSLISVLLTNTVSLTAPLNPHRLIKLTSRYHKSLFCMLLGPFRFTSFYALRLFAVSPGMFQGAQRKYRP
jgi:hypothetical protein